jgi:hypothetical protein
MMSSSDKRNLSSLSNESRQAVTAAFDTLGHWRAEILSVNDRYLTKAIDQMAAAQRALGWPSQVVATAKEHLLKTSRLQTEVIDQVMEGWEQLLKSPGLPAAGPEAFKLPIPDYSGAALSEPMSEMMRFGEMTLAPFKLWMQATEMWQRSCLAVMSGSAEPRSSFTGGRLRS